MLKTKSEDAGAVARRLLKLFPNRRKETIIAAVKLYTKPACPQCTMTKRALEARGIIFREESLTTDSAQQFADMGLRSAPVVVTESHTWAGFQPDLIDSIAA